jgi:hypothetical protein
MQSLETLTFIPLLDLYLSTRIVVYQKKTGKTGTEQFILEVCNKAC